MQGQPWVLKATLKAGGHWVIHGGHKVTGQDGLAKVRLGRNWW